jgi:hypothetical protein
MLNANLHKYKIDGSKPEVMSFMGNEGAALLLICEANAHIESGGWVSIENLNTNATHLFTRKIEV